MAIPIHKTIDFLKFTSQELEKQRAILKKSELYDANQFNPFRFFTTNENGLSAILAFLLNPKETHGQGDLLLNSFLKKLKLHSFLSYETVKVSLEKAARGSMRRHDIFLQGFIGSNLVWVISIENKLRYANDQRAQVADYLKDLYQYSVDNYCLVYLPTFTRDPSESSIPEDLLKIEKEQNKLKILDANDLIDWLENIPIFAPKIKLFNEFFLKFLKEDIMGESVESNVLIDHILEDEKKLDAALQIIAAEQQIRESLWEKLRAQLEKKCEEQYPFLVEIGWRITSYFLPSSRRAMWIRFAKYDGIERYHTGVAIEFNGTQYRDCYYCAWMDEDYYTKNKYKQLKKKINIIGKEIAAKETDYILEKCFEYELRNWEPSTWLRIPSGDLSDEIFEKWKPILDIFEESFKVEFSD